MRILGCEIVLVSPSSFVSIPTCGKRKERSESDLTLWVLATYLWNMTQVSQKALIFFPDVCFHCTAGQWTPRPACRSEKCILFQEIITV